jgi:uncharacterized Zn-binding protein involved in type VI secretion
MLRIPAIFSDPVTHDCVVPCGVVLGPPVPCPEHPVVIHGQPAAHVGCTVYCTGVTMLGPAHPPLPPGASAPGPGGTGYIPPEPPGGPGSEPSPGKKKMKIRVRGGASLAASAFEVLGAEGELTVFEILDVETGESALFLLSPPGSSVISSIGLCWGTPISGDVKTGGGWNEFEAPAEAGLDEVRPYMEMYGASLNVTSVHQIASTTTIALRIGDERIVIHDFDYGDAVVIGTAPRAMIGTGELDEIPFTRSVVAPVPSPAAVMPIVTGSSRVYIHGQPAARWGDVAGCGTLVGSLIPPARRVYIG